MKKTVLDLSNLLIVLSTLAFILFYFILSYYQRPTSDDVGFISMSKQDNIVENIHFVYYNWSGRWASVIYYLFVIGLTDSFLHIHYFYFLYYVVTFLILLYSVNTLIRFAILQLFDIQLINRYSLLYSILFIACFHFFTFEAIEAWWWPCASFSYLFGITCLLLGTALIIRKKSKLTELPIIALCFTYVGGCLEIYAFIVTSLFLLIFMFHWKNRQKMNGLEKYKLSFLIAFCCLFISMLICIAAPGNHERMTWMINRFGEPTHTMNQFFAGLGAHLLQKKYIPAILLASLWMLPGMKLRKDRPVLINRKQFVKIVQVTTIPILVSILICSLFQITVLKFFPVPAKAWTFTSLGLAVLFCECFLFIGYSIQLSGTSSYLLKLVFPFFTAAILFSYAYRQYNYARAYAKAYDEVIDKLLEAKKNNFKGTLFVTHLPDPGMLTCLFIGEKYVNEPIKKILELDFDIQLKK